MNWVPVERGLPSKPNTLVLIRRVPVRSMVTVMNQIDLVYFWDVDTWQYALDGSQVREPKRITHWCLVEPPKGLG